MIPRHNLCLNIWFLLFFSQTRYVAVTSFRIHEMILSSMHWSIHWFCYVVQRRIFLLRHNHTQRRSINQRIFSHRRPSFSPAIIKSHQTVYHTCSVFVVCLFFLNYCIFLFRTFPLFNIDDTKDRRPCYSPKRWTMTIFSLDFLSKMLSNFVVFVDVHDVR